MWCFLLFFVVVLLFFCWLCVVVVLVGFFDTPVVVCFFAGFGVVVLGWVCVVVWFGVCFSSVAAERFGFLACWLGAWVVCVVVV